MLTVVGGALPDPPYPPDVRARGWRFELDHERIEQSDTWALAPPECKPWLLMLWLTAWRAMPCGSLTDNDELIAARIGMPLAQFIAVRSVLMRGWARHSDGRLYHPVITERVLELVRRRKVDADRVKAWRETKDQALAPDVTRNQRVSTAPEPEPEEKEIPSTHVLGVLGPPEGGPEHPPLAGLELEPEDSEGAQVRAVAGNCPAQEIVELYHRTLPTLPRVMVLNETRRKYLRARWREYAVLKRWRTRAEGIEFFRAYFEHVEKSPFLTGRARGRDDKPPFEADLEWLMRPGNWAKTIEGKYHR